MIQEESIISVLRTGIFDYLLPALFLLAFLTFVWGTFQYYVHGSADEEIKEKALTLMFYGLVVFFLMLCVWTLFTIVIPLR
jgi:fumarate reductase subunit D